ncbi:unnamed protein product [Gadus morhua 'NCC']
MGLRVGGQRSEPVLWPGHMGSGWEVRGQSPSSGRVTWGSGWEVRGQSPSSGRVTWGSGWEVRGQSPSTGRGHMGLQGEVGARPLAGSHGAQGGRSEGTPQEESKDPPAPPAASQCGPHSLMFRPKGGGS